MPVVTNSITHIRNTDTNEGHWHSIIVKPRPDLPKIHFYNKLNPVWWFENLDDPLPPASYRPNDPHRVGMWHWRNSMHNFDYYVIGIADKQFMRSGCYPARITKPHNGWNFALCRRRILFLPYASYRHGRFEFYLGWRNHGNFGIKLNYSDSNLPTTNAPATSRQ